MLIGVLGIGILLASIGAVGALIAGQSFITALIVYVLVGLVSTVAAAGGIFVCRSRFRSNPSKVRADPQSVHQQ